MGTFSRPQHLNQKPDALFGCPCGKVGSYGHIVGHRHGWKLRPECNGKMIDFDPPVKAAAASTTVAGETVDTVTGEIHVTPAPPTQSETITPDPETIDHDDETFTPPPKPLAFEADPIDESGDEEEIARQVLARRGIAADPAGLSWWQDAHKAASEPPSSNGGSSGSDGGNGDDELPPGEWREEPPGLPVQPSQARETVTLPVQVRLMYDWMKGQGWNAGQGTLSDWVTDIVMDHWKNCLGMGIFILRREEVEVA